MNKRILKLFNEAGFHQPEMERLGIEDKFEKFAELIVKECANLIKSKAGQVDDMRPIGVFQEKVMNEDANLILKHFGIEK